jgi:hypothetical protein
MNISNAKFKKNQAKTSDNFPDLSALSGYF